MIGIDPSTVAYTQNILGGIYSLIGFGYTIYVLYQLNYPTSHYNERVLDITTAGVLDRATCKEKLT